MMMIVMMMRMMMMMIYDFKVVCIFICIFTRILFNRLESIPGPHVFVSPVAEAEFADDLTVRYTVPGSVSVPSDSTVSLVVWNPGG